MIVGVAGHPATRTEQWQLIAPPVGAADVVVTLASPGWSFHASAMVFGNVDQTTPMRDRQEDYGMANSSSVTVASHEADLVESCVGHGGGISTATGDATTVFVDNASMSTSLDNAACSTSPGANDVVTMSWAMLDSDHFQEIAASLQPPI
jgi:hypothetical protein